jgi:hypothetical protein
MLEYYPFWLGVVFMLAVYLWISVERRQRKEDARFQAGAAERWERGKRSPEAPSHIADIAPRIQRLRQDQFAAAHSRPHYAFYRRGLLAAALKAVASFQYFRNAKSEHKIDF